MQHWGQHEHLHQVRRRSRSWAAALQRNLSSSAIIETVGSMAWRLDSMGDDYRRRGITGAIWRSWIAANRLHRSQCGSWWRCIKCCRGVGCDPGWCQIQMLRSRLYECGTADWLLCGTSMERKLNAGSIHNEHGCGFHNSKGILSPLFQLQWLCVWPTETYMCGMQVSNM